MKKLLLSAAGALFTLLVSSQVQINMTGMVLCADSTQYTSGGVNYIFLDTNPNSFLNDTIGIPLNADGSFSYSFSPDMNNPFSVIWFDGTGSEQAPIYYWAPDSTSFTMIFDACGDPGNGGGGELDPCAVDIGYVADSLTDDGLFVFLYANVGSALQSYTWDFGDGNNSSEFSPVHEYTEAGTYTVCMTAVGGGCIGSDCIEITVDANGGVQFGGGMMIQGFTLIVNGAMPSSVDELAITTWSIYPNPMTSADRLMIQTDQTLSGTIQLTSATGQLIESKRINLTQGTNTLPFEANSLANGMYFVRFAADNGQHAEFKLNK